ncbi:MAG: cation-translocating P-type ATPase [Polyangiaceae bacterium]|nr:cation-translocating P-type ATPase [Polyangiaceae bacterium]
MADAARAASVLVPCATCGADTDPLRADRVAIYGERFRYFCSTECRDRYDPSTHLTPLPLPRRRRPSALSEEQVVATRHETSAELDARRQAAAALADVAELAPPAEDPEIVERRSPEPPPLLGEEARGDVTDVGALLLSLAMLGGTLAVALLLAGSSGVALTSRVVVLTVATAALVAQALSGERDPADLHPAALLAAPVLGTLAAIVARITDAARAPSAITLAGVVVACIAGGVWLVQRARRPVDAEREHIALELDAPTHRVIADEIAEVRAVDLRPGEEIVVEAGETVPVDATIVAGEATVAPWLGAKTTAELSEGDPIVAGARVVQGRIRSVVAWAGFDRAWLRLTSDPRRRADLLAPLARAGRLTAERAAPFAAGLAALTAFAENQSTLTIAMFAIAAQASLATAGIAQIGAMQVATAVLAALRRGIVFRSATALDKAGRVTIAAFCARGTLLLGEPEVASIVPMGDAEAERVLSLMAGAESGSPHPVATALVRAARARGIRPDGVRSPNVVAGLGVTAVAANGQPLVVGSRALMLRERISVAAAEPKIGELEAMGRTVMLVALGGRLIGVVGLQDGLRPGARAAVQHLLDVNVEPVLLSGDARETCEAIGRTLDIEHIRPEILPAERGDEIARLADGGATVAVLGCSPADDIALGAANVSVALASAGSSAAEWNVQLASDDVRDAALALRVAHEARSEARLGLILAIAPGAIGALAVAFALIPPAAAPIAALLGTAGALFRLRSLSA